MTAFLMESVEDSTLALARFVANKLGAQQGQLVAQCESLLAQGDQEGAAGILCGQMPLIVGAPEEERRVAATMLMAVASKVPDPQATRVVEMLVRAAEQLPPEDRLATLVDLFNFTHGPFRYPVVRAILSVGVSEPTLSASVATMIRPNAEKWAREWGLGPADSAGLYLATARVVSASGAGAEDLMPLYNAAMWALDGQTTTGSEVSRAANEAARLFLSSPTVFECDLLGSSAVQQLLRSSPEVATLNALVSGNMKDLVSLLNQHPGVLESCKTTKDLVLRKGRVMALLATAQEADGSPIPYKKLTEALQVEAPELERVVVEVVGAGLLDAKLDQVREEVVCKRWTFRTFTMSDWAHLRDQLKRVGAPLRYATSGRADGAAPPSDLALTPQLGGSLTVG